MSIKILKEVVENIFIAPLCKNSENGTINVVKPSIINNGLIDEEKFDKCEYDEKFEKSFLKKGDILFQAKGNKIEATLINKDYENLISNQIYFNVRVSQEILPEYLVWYLNSEEAKLYYEKNTSGATVKSINKKVLEHLKIEIPSLEKQKELVSLISGFLIEKEKTLKYLEKKEKLINEAIKKVAKGGE